MTERWYIEDSLIYYENVINNRVYFLIWDYDGEWSASEIWTGYGLNDANGLYTYAYEDDIIYIYCTDTYENANEEDMDIIMDELISELGAAYSTQDFVNDANLTLLGTFIVGTTDEIIINNNSETNVTWTIGNKEVSSLVINNKVVKSIKNLNTNTIIYGSVRENSTITLSVNSNSVTYGNGVTFTGTLDVGSGKNINLYDGDTLFGTTTTSTNGAFTYTEYYFGSGLHNIKAVFSGDASHDGSQSNIVTVTVNKATPTLSCSVSSSTVNYGSSFTISGTLSAGSGKSVKIYDGDTLLTTVTTGNNGTYSYSNNSLNVGSHTIKATFDGNTNYNNVNSSNVTVTISKATPTLTATPSSSTITTSEGQFNVTGALSNNIVGTVKLYAFNNNQWSDTNRSTATDVDGSYSFVSVPLTTLGTTSFQVRFMGNSNYNVASSSTFTVTVVSASEVDSIVVTSDKSTVYAHNSQTATITATLYKSDGVQTVSGESVVLKANDTTVKTATSDSNGQISYTYTSQGYGEDIVFTAEANNKTGTYTLYDTYWYTANGSGLGGTKTNGSDSSYSYITSLGTDVYSPKVISDPFELTFKAWRSSSSTTNRALLWCIGASTSNCLLVGWDGGSATTDKNMKIYTRVSSSNTSAQGSTSPDYTNGSWFDVKIQWDGHLLSFNVGSTTLYAPLDSITIIQNYSTSNCRIAEWELKYLRVDSDYYYNSNEVGVTRSGSVNYYAYDSALTMTDFPSNYIWKADIKTTGATSSGEHRMYLTPTSAYETSMANSAQPNPSIYFGFNNSQSQMGTRTSSTSNTNSAVVGTLNNNYHKFRVVKNGNAFAFYVDGKFVVSKTFSNMNSYTEFKFLMVIWSAGTLTAKNVRIRSI